MITACLKFHWRGIIYWIDHYGPIPQFSFSLVVNLSALITFSFNSIKKRSINVGFFSLYHNALSKSNKIVSLHMHCHNGRHYIPLLKI